MTESIIKTSKCCFFCGRTDHLERHHCMKAANRKKSEALGLWVWLCPDCHRGTDGVHGKNGHGKDESLKMAAEYAFLQEHSLEEWMRIFGKNYL